MKKCKSCEKEVKWGKYASEAELQSGLCPDCWNKPFPITSVCRSDMQSKFTPEQIGKMSDSDMTRLANKMADAYTDHGGFWGDLEIIAEDILDSK